jgi:hypothetical protein
LMNLFARLFRLNGQPQKFCLAKPGFGQLLGVIDADGSSARQPKKTHA